MRLIGVEVKGSPEQVSEQPLVAPAHELRWEKARLRAYNLNLEPEQNTGELHYCFSGATIWLDTACVTSLNGQGESSTTMYSAGDVVWHQGPVTKTLINEGERNARAILVEWR